MVSYWLLKTIKERERLEVKRIDISTSLPIFFLTNMDRIEQHYQSPSLVGKVQQKTKHRV